MLSARWRRALGATIVCVCAALVAAGCGSDSDEKSSSESSSNTSPIAAEPKSPNAAEPKSPDADEPAAPKTTTFEATIASGQPKGGPQVWRAKKGDRVRITVRSDVADELHLHGYNVSKDVPAGGSATLELVADTTGSFELELEDAGALVGNLEVR